MNDYRHGYNFGHQRLTRGDRLMAPIAWVLIFTAVILTTRLLQQLGFTSDVVYGLPGFAFAAWCIAWTTLVHNATIESAGSVWARRILVGLAVAGAALPIVGLATIVP